MRISDAMIKYLYDNGVRHAFGIPTAQIGGFSDGLNDYDIEYIVVKNEAAATYSAGRYADMKRDLGVCFIGGCVGVNNAINGIGDSYRNKLPLIVVSSVVATDFTEKNALQELNTTEITKSITKYSETIYTKDEVLNELKKAVEIALTPPYGPVHISIPLDVQTLPFTQIMPELVEREKLMPKFDGENLEKAIECINESQTGVIMVGRGARGLTEEIKILSKKLQWPIITTPNAKGIIDAEFEYNLGNYGWCTTDCTAYYIDNTKVDCLLVLGTSLGQMSTRVYKDTLVKGKRVIHVDWDKSELNKIFKVDIPVFYDLSSALKEFNFKLNTKSNKFIKPNLNKPYIKSHTGLSLRQCMENIVDIVPENTCFVQDMGENMNFTFKYLKLKEKMDFQSSIHYAAMGTAVAGVMGAYLADSSKTYVVIVGDGSFFMNGMELLTAKEHNMPIIYFIVNNSMLGLVEHGGNFVFGRSHKGKCRFSKVSITNITNAMGINSIQISELKELDKLKGRLHNLKGPFVVEVITDGSEVCLDGDRW